MKINKKMIALTAAMVIGTMNLASAASLTRYAEMLGNHRCTIRYTNITPGERMHARGKIDLTYSYRLAEPPEYVNQQYDGTIVLAGDQRFLDLDYGTAGKCRLTRDGKDYLYSYTEKKDSRKYKAPDGSRDVKPTDHDTAADLIYGEDFGPENVTRLLTAMLPAEKKPLGSPDYRYAGEGTLAGGLHYEDYRTSDASGLEAIRYYFDASGTLLKIAAATYTRRSDGGLDGRKCVLKINEFTDTPDSSRLSLPEGLKIVKEGK